MFEVELENGKYKVINDNGVLTAKRHGEDWPAADSSLCGDKLSLAMMHKIEQQQEILNTILKHMSSNIDMDIFVHSGLQIQDDIPTQILKILNAYNYLLASV
jgi:hypothetical protein